jgi:hypothetical protein
MTTAQNKNVIEGYFWQTAIPLLSSGNRTIAAIVRVGARIYPILEQASLPLKALFWAWVGLSIGLGIGILIG